MPNKKKIFFRADASDTIGYGHFTRSLALAEMLKRDFDCTFITQEPTENQKLQIEAVCKLVVLPANDCKFSMFLEMLKGDEIVFLDNYFFTSDYQQAIKEKGCKLICLGTNDRHYYCDVLFNFAESDSSIFTVEPYTKIKLGLDWAILRKPFREVHSIRPTQPQNRVAICYGGTDQFQLTEATVQAIRTMHKPLDIKLIATERFGLERIGKLRENGVECLINATAEQMIEVFNQCDYLISSASTIAHEGLACQIPVICGYYVENQRSMYDYLIENHLVIGLSDMLSTNWIDTLENALTSPYQNKELKAYSYNGVEQRYISLFKSL